LPQALLRAENLRFEYDDLLLFEQLSFSVMPGEVVYIEGPNGSGKTTLLKILSGLIDPIEGQVYWQDKPINRGARTYQQAMLYQGHQSGIKDSLSARENLKWLMSLKGLRDVGQIEEALAASNLAGFEDIPCGHLSAGQKRRVGLARLLINDDNHQTAEKLWILDEPFTAIDKSGVAALEATINKHAQRGGMVMITTHQEMQLTVPTQRIVLG